MSQDIDTDWPTVNENEVTAGMVPADSERAAARYVRLVQEIGRELGMRHGWKSEVARRLDVDQSYLSRLLSRERTSVGVEKIQQAVRRMRISHEYFYGVKDPVTYRDYIVRSEPPYAAWREFLDTELGRSMTADERSTLASPRFHRDPTVALYQGWLLHMRGELRTTREAVTALNESLDQELSSRNAKRIDDDPGDE